MPKAYGYTRVSSIRQAQSGASLDSQEIAVKEFYERVLKPQGYTWGGMFTDEAVTSKTPMLQRKQGYKILVKCRKSDAVIAAVFDRAFRSVIDWCVTDETFKKLHVDLHLVNCSGIDSSTPEGRLHLNMLASFAQFEREIISRRTKEAFAVVRMRCKKCKHSCNEHDPDTRLCEHKHCKCPGFVKTQLGNPFPKIGVKWNNAPRGKKKKVWDTHERELMGKIVEWRDKGYTWEEIYWHMFRSKMVTSKGKEWSFNRIKRSYVREKEYQAGETATQKPSWEIDSALRSSHLGEPQRSGAKQDAALPTVVACTLDSASKEASPISIGSAAPSQEDDRSKSQLSGHLNTDASQPTTESFGATPTGIEPFPSKSAEESGGESGNAPGLPSKRRGMWSRVYEAVMGR